MNCKNKTVKDIMEKIDSKEILLPAMQRKFVWEEDQIITLFDSIMKGYPFGTFIFWNISDRSEISKYHFYEFIKDYSKRDKTINARAGKSGKTQIDVVMDGQQRLTSLYIGIKGSITTIEKGQHHNKAENWKKKHLYFVPHLSADERNEDETPFRFVFLEDTYANEENKKRQDPEKFWLVSNLYNKTKKELHDEFGVQRIRKNEEDWKYTLEKLRFYINDAEILTYHTITDTNITDVLEIFKRINNGGTKLSPSNLLFSTVITSWEDGRERMDEFIQSINKEEKQTVILREDFIIRACVYLTKGSASTKLNILTRDVVEEIKNNWEKISQAITNTKNFLQSKNIYHNAILSYNALLPIMYFYYNSGNISRPKKEESEEQLFRFFAISQMFSLFGGSSSSTLDAVRKAMCVNGEHGNLIIPFQLKNLYSIDLSAGRYNAFQINRDHIEKLVDSVQYNDKKSYVLLSLLQYKADLQRYDVDHICPTAELKKVFSKRRKEYRKELERKKDNVANLQLLTPRENREEKNADTLYTWVVEKKNKIPLDPFANDPEKHRINTIEDFEDFYNRRRSLVIDCLCTMISYCEDGKKQK